MKFDKDIDGHTKNVSIKCRYFPWDIRGDIKEKHLRFLSHFGLLSNHSAVVGFEPTPPRRLQVKVKDNGHFILSLEIWFRLIIEAFRFF